MNTVVTILAWYGAFNVVTILALAAVTWRAGRGRRRHGHPAVNRYYAEWGVRR